MKKTMKCLVAVFVMAFAFVMTGISAQAAEVNNSEKLEKLVKAEIMNVGTASDKLSQVGTGSSYVQQTDAGKNSVTVTWSSPYSQHAEGYAIYLGDSLYTQVDAATTSATISGLSAGTSYTVVVCFINGGQAYYLDTEENTYAVVKTAPAKMTSDAIDIIWKKDDKITVSYVDKSLYVNGYYYEKYIDGIEFRVKTLKGATKKTYKKPVTKQVSVYGAAEDIIDSFTFSAPKAIKNKGMQYQIRTYMTLPNGKKVYSDWTSNTAFIPQAKVTNVKSAGSNKIKYTWKKVSGAKSYTIFKTTNGGKSFKKVKTVSANTTSYTVSGVKANNINHGVWIRADKVKVGKKKVNSTQSYYTYLTIRYY